MNLGGAGGANHVCVGGLRVSEATPMSTIQTRVRMVYALLIDAIAYWLMMTPARLQTRPMTTTL